MDMPPLSPCSKIELNLVPPKPEDPTLKHKCRRRPQKKPDLVVSARTIKEEYALYRGKPPPNYPTPQDDPQDPAEEGRNVRPCAVDVRDEANLTSVESSEAQTQQEDQQAEEGRQPSRTPTPLPDHPQEGGRSHPDGSVGAVKEEGQREGERQREEERKATSTNGAYATSRAQKL